MDTEQRRRQTRQYDPTPHYPVRDGAVAVGWAAAAATVPETARTVAVDGPAALNWPAVAEALADALATTHGEVSLADVRAVARDWAQVLQRTETTRLAEDPHFARLAGGSLGDLLDPAALTALAAHDGAGLRVLYGPGAGLADADVLWWAEVPKRFQEAAVAAGSGRHLAAPADVPTGTRRLFYIDWPLLDRHRDALADRLDRWLDVTDTAEPASVTGTALRATCRALAEQPFRTRPTFNSTPWGGHWGQQELGHNPTAPNTALGYELIAPESGVLLGDAADRAVEVPFQLIVGLSPADVLGPAVHELFGTSFPIRFDYLDTVGGGNLSVHCHPQPDTMRTVFGWPYTQHESYYLMHAGEHGKVFLGLRGDADVDAFHQAAHDADAHGVGFDIEQYVQTFQAEAGQLYLVPGGTPHGSGEGNVVLEVSATPYLYSLRFYDWLRRDAAGAQRAVHVEHAFDNLDPKRAGTAVADQLIQHPRVLASGDGWHEELLGALPEMFFQVYRIVVEPDAVGDQHTDARFHVLTVVDGDGALISTASGATHRLNYAETLAIPADVGRYQVHAIGPDQVRLVKAQVA